MANSKNKINTDQDYDYKQIAFKLQGDIEMLRWDLAQKDLIFLKEMRDHAKKAFEKNDVTAKDMLLKMIEDWIDELEKIP